jgi:hypothetical protein
MDGLGGFGLLIVGGAAFLMPSVEVFFLALSRLGRANPMASADGLS